MKLVRLSIAFGSLICAAALSLSACAGRERPRQSGAVAPSAASCAQLVELALDNVRIDSARVMPALTPIEGARRPDMTGRPQGAEVSGLPAFCRVMGSIHPEAGSDVRFEVWMPLENWNGRFFGANNGGLAGSIRYDDLAAAIMNGGAGAATDTGHSDADVNWARGRPERVRDYGWRGIHETTVTAKDIIDSFYGRRPDRSYFVGCSNGGRMGLIEAARFPEDYDGIVAGAPGIDFTQLTSSMINAYRVQQAPGAAIRPEQTQFLQDEVRRQCDALDGQADGIVVNPLRCRIDYSALACGRAESPRCFSAAQIEALRQIHAGPHDSAGRRVAYGYPPSGSEVSLQNAGWDQTIMSASNAGLAAAFVQDLPPTPIATQDTFNYDTDPARLRAAVGADLDTPPDLRRFFARGGKLIIWHGWADPLLPPEATLNYYQEALRTSGPRAAEQMRLFMIPGMQHCSGGVGADAFGQIGAAPAGASAEDNVAAAVVEWVERGRTPETLIGRHGNRSLSEGQTQEAEPMQRLHCAFPAEPVLRAGADPSWASSYSCAAPPH